MNTPNALTSPRAALERPAMFVPISALALFSASFLMRAYDFGQASNLIRGPLLGWQAACGALILAIQNFSSYESVGALLWGAWLLGLFACNLVVLAFPYVAFFTTSGRLQSRYRKLLALSCVWAASVGLWVVFGSEQRDALGLGYGCWLAAQLALAVSPMGRQSSAI